MSGWVYSGVVYPWLIMYMRVLCDMRLEEGSGGSSSIYEKMANTNRDSATERGRSHAWHQAFRAKGAAS